MTETQEHKTTQEAAERIRDVTVAWCTEFVSAAVAQRMAANEHVDADFICAMVDHAMNLANDALREAVAMSMQQVVFGDDVNLEHTVTECLAKRKGGNDEFKK